MVTLHIEHPISDLITWLSAFGNFAEARQRGGAHAYRVYQPVDDNKYIMIDLDFDTVDEALGESAIPEEWADQVREDYHRAARLHSKQALVCSSTLLCSVL